MKELKLENTVRIYNEDEIDDEMKNLIDLAKKATYKSYSPYSNFKVGASLIMENGEIFTGCNQENAAYPAGICAERTAVFAAQSQYPDSPIRRLVIVGRDTHDEWTKSVCAPCGMCRQVILEAEQRGGKKIEIILPCKDGIFVINGISTLLPFGFSDEYLI